MTGNRLGDDTRSFLVFAAGIVFILAVATILGELGL